MRHQKAIVSLLLALVVISFPVSLSAKSAEASGYRTNGSGTIEFNEDGTPKSMSGDAFCAGVKYEAESAAQGEMGVMVPEGTAVDSVKAFSDASMTSPLVVGGNVVVFQPSDEVAARAEAFAGPAPDGFRWLGFITNDLLENVTGEMQRPFTWVLNFGYYPTSDDVGPHQTVIYISDNAVITNPAIDSRTIY